MKKIVRLTESDLIKLVKRVIKEEEGSDCSKFKEISRQEFMNDVKNLSLSSGSDTDEAKSMVMKSKKIYKFNGNTDDANNNLSCINMKMGDGNYDYYEPGLYSRQKPGYFYIGVW